MLQAHEANTSKNVNHEYDKDNIGSDLDMEKLKVQYDIVIVCYSNLLIQTGGLTRWQSNLFI